MSKNNNIREILLKLSRMEEKEQRQYINSLSPEEIRIVTLLIATEMKHKANQSNTCLPTDGTACLVKAGKLDKRPGPSSYQPFQQCSECLDEEEEDSKYPGTRLTTPSLTLQGMSRREREGLSSLKTAAYRPYNDAKERFLEEKERRREELRRREEPRRREIRREIREMIRRDLIELQQAVLAEQKQAQENVRRERILNVIHFADTLTISSKRDRINKIKTLAEGVVDRLNLDEIIYEDPRLAKYATELLEDNLRKRITIQLIVFLIDNMNHLFNISSQLRNRDRNDINVNNAEIVNILERNYINFYTLLFLANLPENVKQLLIIRFGLMTE